MQADRLWVDSLHQQEPTTGMPRVAARNVVSGPACASTDVARVHVSTLRASNCGERGQKMHPRDFAAGFEATALHHVLKGLPSNCVKNPATVMFVGSKAGACSFSDMALGRLLRYLPLGLAVHAAAVAVRLVPAFPAFPSSIISAADTALADPAFPRREHTSCMLSGSGEWCSTWWSTCPLWAKIRTNPRV